MDDSMTQPPQAGEGSLSASSDSKQRSRETNSTVPNLIQGGTQAGEAQSGLVESDETGLVDQGGRLLGPRARQTRQRILDATVTLLSESSMRDLRVIDIARRIGSSPATFYQYFKDVEDVVLHLASEASEHTPEMVDLIHGDWTGQQGHDRGLKLVGLAIDHWDKYAPILRVRNNAADEGDKRFREVRVRTLIPMLDAFAREIAASHRRAAKESEQSEGDEWQGGRVDATAGATALTSVLERLAMYHEDIEAIGTSRERIIDTAATLIQFIMTSRR
jgi:AcrR family transcriptional regulator